jgi:hypothetical protein
VIPNIKNGRRKVKLCWFGAGNWFWLSTIAEFTFAGIKAQYPRAPPEKRKECNEYDLAGAQCF